MDKIDFATSVVTGITFASKNDISVPAEWSAFDIDTKTVTLPSTGKWMIIGGTSYTGFAISSEYRLLIRNNGSPTHQTQYVSQPLQGVTHTLVFDTNSTEIQVARVYSGARPSSDGGKLRIGDSVFACIKIG